MAGTGSEKQGHLAGSSSQPSQSNAPQIEEKQDDGPNGDGNDGTTTYTLIVEMLSGETTELQLSLGETGMEVRQRLQNILGSDEGFTSYALRLRDKKNDFVDRLEHYQTISDVADISTGEFQLEMVPDHDGDVVVGDENEEEQPSGVSPLLIHDERTPREKAYHEFVAAATKGAVEIINGNITPINPTEAQNLHRMYVHNNIFFTHIVDTDMEEFLKREKESDTTSASGAEKTHLPICSVETNVYEQSSATTNREPIGTIVYDEAGITGLDTLLMARVDHRGHRLLAQSILLGISDSTQHGSTENGENFIWNEELKSKEALAEAVKCLRMEEHSVHDEPGNAFTLVAPATSKDIADRRYIWHFPRDTPHDADNTGPGSLFRISRPELIAASCRGNAKGLRIEVDEKVIREAKEFLDVGVIQDFIVDFTSGDSGIETLTKRLHKRGINVRSIGKVAESVFDPELQKLCSNEIIVRSAKHILKAVLRDVEGDPNQVISHFFNCLFENVAVEVDAQIKEKTTNALDITPESLWHEIQAFARFKYRYELTERSHAKDKHIQKLMQDILWQKVGITLNSGLQPVVSAIFIDSEAMVEREKFQVAKALLSEAFKSYSQALLHQVTSPPIVLDVASCCRFLALILHGDKSNGAANRDGDENEEEQPRGVAPLLVHDESDLALVLHHVGGDINNANMQQEDHSETAQRILEVGESSRRHSKLSPIRHPNQNELTMPPSLFEIGQKVIVYWCQGLYRARVLGKYLYEGGLWRYYIGYYENGEEPKEKKDKDTEYTPEGNNQRQVEEPEDKWEGFKPWVGWNQWVIERRLLRASQENINLMAENESKLFEKEGTEPDSWIVYPPDLEEEDDPIAKDRKRLENKLGVHIPSSLYISWIEDREISIHLGKIIDIAKPITWTVDRIIIDFGHYHRRIMGPSDDHFDETSQRMIKHFEMQLANLNLLYETEKHNLPHHSPSRIYGGEHLLRMLVSLDNGLFGPPILEELFRYLDIHHNQVFNVELVEANGDGDAGHIVVNEDRDEIGDAGHIVVNEDRDEIGDADLANEDRDEPGDADPANEDREDDLVWDEDFRVWVALNQ